MKLLTTFSLVAWAALLGATLCAATAMANETAELNGQTVVLWTPTTADALELEIAKPAYAAKVDAVKSLLLAEATAKGGFCDTAVDAYKSKQPNTAKIRDACEYVINDPETIKVIANGDLSRAVDPARPQITFRQKLSEAVSGYIIILALL